MKWGFRWYGEKGDSIPLNHVRQIPGINGVVGTLLNKLPGDVWEVSEIRELKESIEKENLELLGIESVAIHDAIKAGTAERDQYIENYIQTIKNLSKCGVHLICYSFKPIFGWAKTTLNYENEDGSLALLYDQAVVDNMEPGDMYKLISSQSKGFQLSGWEEERLNKFNSLVEMYEGVTEEVLFDNLKYFLEKIIPICEEADVKWGIHPDDPPWEILVFLVSQKISRICSELPAWLILHIMASLYVLELWVQIRITTWSKSFMPLVIGSTLSTSVM